MSANRDLRHLKVGDRVERWMGSGDQAQMWMLMEVVDVREKVVECAAVEPHGALRRFGWTFDRATGAEEDEDLQWGVAHGRTGSYLREAP